MWRFHCVRVSWLCCVASSGSDACAALLRVLRQESREPPKEALLPSCARRPGGPRSAPTGRRAAPSSDSDVTCRSARAQRFGRT
eukprot:6101982-Pleurochrysis_carterae.AAC.1